MRQVPQSDLKQMSKKLKQYILDNLKTSLRQALQKKYGDDVDAWNRSLTRLLSNPVGFKNIEVTAIREVYEELNGEEVST
jgi:hypothetical protein